MRHEPYFYELIAGKGESRIYGDLAYGARVKDLISLYEGLSSLEKLEFQEAIKKLLASGDSILVEIALAVCTGFIEAGSQTRQQFNTLKNKMLKG